MNKLDNTYMQMAKSMSVHSKANRAKVGAVLVTKQGVVLTGYNGTPSGWSNTCEDQEYDSISEEWVYASTKAEVIHAELNCLLKAAREGVSTIGSTVYTTLAPCLHCSAMLASAGVTRVLYSEDYRDIRGASALRVAGIFCEKTQ